MESRSNFIRRFSLLALTVTVVTAASAACQGRERRAIQQDPLPVTGTTTQTDTGALPRPVDEEQGGQIQPATDGETGTGSESDTGTGTGTGTLGTGGTGTGTGLVITTQLENGQTATLQWDGKSFLGNDQWDVVPANP